MKRSHSKLALDKQTLRVLESDELSGVAGGWIHRPITISCPQPPPSSANGPKTMA
jgi:hypothetical protein